MKINNHIHKYYLLAVLFFSLQHLSTPAQENEIRSVMDRFFMPALQLGYIQHNSPVITSGFMLQTSLEYRTRKNWLFRLNYDDFSGKLHFENAQNQFYSARIPISDLIAGVGYRFTNKRHNYFLLAQAGVRFYENPIIEGTVTNLNIEQQGANIGTARYTLGYEYEFLENMFLNTEVFMGHFLREKDYWGNSKPFYGITFGIGARLF